jgi:hypothetical protein
MKRFLSLLAFLIFTLTFVAAQGNGNNGNGNGNGWGNNGNGNNGNGNGNAWGNANWPNWLISWLENGGQIPPVLAHAVIWEAREWGRQNFNLNYGQMISKYVQGQLTIEYLSVAPPMLFFRVSYSGLGISVILDNI